MEAESTEPARSKGSRVTVWTGVLAGVAALVGGALLTGSSHYAATGKALQEEGLDPKMRLRAVPVAVPPPPPFRVCCPPTRSRLASCHRANNPGTADARVKVLLFVVDHVINAAVQDCICRHG